MGGQVGRVIAIANQKGGVGKTTTAVNLAACLAAAERRTLLIDMDPQSNATSGLGLRVGKDDASIYEVLTESRSVDETVRGTDLEFLYLLPSHIRLVGTEVELVNAIAREKKLAGAIKGIRGDYDFIIIDSPPSLGLLTLNALTAADSLLIPIQCEYYALEGLGQLLNTIRLVQRYLNPELRLEGVLLTMFDTRLNLSKQVAQEAKSYFGSKVYQTVISRNVRLSEAPSFGKPIILYDISSSGARNYMLLAKEVIDGGKKGFGKGVGGLNLELSTAQGG